LCCYNVSAQPPQMFNYQAVIRNSSGVIVAKQHVSLRVSILADSPTGTLLYRERDTVKTNAYGLVNLKIGGGILISGNFSTINWQTGSKYLEIAFDINAGTNYTVLGTTQLLSVPYALYAQTSGASGVIGPTGPTGPTGLSCLSLNDAYNGCSGNGSGNQITVSNSKIDVTLPSTSTADQAMTYTIQKGNNASPSYGISISHEQHGNAIFADMTNINNMHSAIRGILRSSNTNTSAYPSALQGVFDGTGCGVGVWGEITSSATTGSGAGLYGIAANNNFGAILTSASYPGLTCKTNSAASQAAQIVSGSASFINPALQVRGWTQFDCSSATASSVLFNNLSGEPTIAPSAAQFGYVGTNSYPWYYLYYMNAIQVSSKETKRNINYLDDNMFELVMADMDKIKPSFYKYKIETDDYVPENPAKYRPQFHLGLILEDTPDYLQDNTFSGIDLYALSTLTLTGVKYNRHKIETIEQELASQPIMDFGIAKMSNKTIHVSYSQEFVNKLKDSDIPVVSITPNRPGITYYIKSQDKTGFVLEINEAGNFEFNWTAYAKTGEAKTKDSKSQDYTTNISSDILKHIRINQAVKDNSKLLFSRKGEKLMGLK